MLLWSPNGFLYHGAASPTFPWLAQETSPLFDLRKYMNLLLS